MGGTVAVWLWSLVEGRLALKTREDRGVGLRACFVPRVASCGHRGNCALGVQLERWGSLIVQPCPRRQHFIRPQGIAEMRSPSAGEDRATAAHPSPSPTTAKSPMDAQRRNRHKRMTHCGAVWTLSGRLPLWDKVETSGEKGRCCVRASKKAEGKSGEEDGCLAGYLMLR